MADIPSVIESAPGAAPAAVRGSVQTIGDVIAAHAAARPQAPAFVGPEFAPISYSELSALIGGVERRLRALAVTPDMRVGLLVPPAPKGALLVVGVANAAELTPINPGLAADEFEKEIARTGIDVLIAPTWLNSPLRALAIAAELPVIDVSMDAELRPVFDLVGEAPSPVSAGQKTTAAPEKIALLLRSSGTTGDPKQIPVTHENLIAMSRKLAAWFKLDHRDRIPCTLPLYYAAGLKTTLFVPLLLGASVGMPAHDQIHDFGLWAETIEPTVLSVAPAPLRGMLDRIRAHAGFRSPKFLRFAICGAAYLPDELRREAEEALGVPVIEYYGLSEGGAMAANPAPPGLRKTGTVGLTPNGELALLDDDGRAVPQGEIGEICITGPSVTPGYVTALDRTPTGRAEGWLRTGDLGRLDADGYLTIVGRRKEIINRGGEKVSPYEVERALMQHPAVADAGVFGVPHPRLGEAVSAAISLKPDASIAETELKRFLEDKLVRYKIPQSIHIVDALPRGPTGKVLRSALAERYAARAKAEYIRPDRMLEHQIMSIWTRLLKRDDLGIDDDFFEAGGDSLLATEMLVEVEALTKKPIPQSRLSSTLTVRMLTDAVCSDLDEGRELLTQVRAGEGVPFFFCHGDYATRGLYAQRLVELIGGSRPIYLLHFYQDLHRPDLTIEEIADSYLAEIEKVYSGPMIVGGYCNGGLVAWELTHRLRKKGVDVRRLLLIEAPSLNARPTFRAIHHGVMGLGKFAPASMRPMIEQDVMRAVWHRLRGLGTFSSLFQSAIGRAWRQMAKKPAIREASSVMPSPHWLYQRTLSRYSPPKIDVPVSCFIAMQGRRMDTDPNYWTRLAPRASSIELPGTHHSLVTCEAAPLAKAMRYVLDM